MRGAAHSHSRAKNVSHQYETLKSGRQSRQRHLQPAGATPVPAPVKPKACVGCRTRKVKCDRRLPCKNCALWSIECVYPCPKRACSRPKKKREGSQNQARGGDETRSSTPSLIPFGCHSVEVAPLHPYSAQVQVCWQRYIDYIDPLVKVLHTPSENTAVAKAISSCTTLAPSEEALLFAVYFASVLSMPAKDTGALLGMDKVTAIRTYRAATEHALMRANFLVTDDLTVLQAFVLFLSLSSFTDEAKLVWPLTGVAQRLLTTDVTSKDGPVSQEIRHRLYWQLWYMDKRAVEDQGKSALDTAPGAVSLPSNITDTELALGHTSPTTQGEGWTEASFLLIRLDIARTRSSLATAQSLYEKEQLIQHCHNRIKSRYLASCDGSQPIHWLAKHVSSVLIAEMWFEIHSAACSSTLGPMISSRSTRAKLFSTAVSIIDIPRRVHEDPQAKAWSWLLKGYLQFQPLLFVAAELASRSMGDSHSVRAWEVAYTALGRWPEEARRTRQGKLLDGLLRNSQERWRGMQQEATLTTASLLTTPLGDESAQESDKLGPTCQ